MPCVVTSCIRVGLLVQELVLRLTLVLALCVVFRCTPLLAMVLVTSRVLVRVVAHSPEGGAAVGCRGCTSLRGVRVREPLSIVCRLPDARAVAAIV